MFELLPDWLKILFFSMLPYFEARYTIPLSMLTFDPAWSWWQALPLAVTGNMIPVPFILLFFYKIEKLLRPYKTWSRLMDWLFKRTRKKADNHIKKYEYIGLFIFVAVPLPLTGAWTGSLIAYLFDLNRVKSFITILLGVIAASFIMIIITLYLRFALSYLGVNI
ncbi:MAG: small multi-drug export protein [Candidatus Thermoplasmatota archaeon]